MVDPVKNWVWLSIGKANPGVPLFEMPTEQSAFNAMAALNDANWDFINKGYGMPYYTGPKPTDEQNKEIREFCEYMKIGVPWS